TNRAGAAHTQRAVILVRAALVAVTFHQNSLLGIGFQEVGDGSHVLLLAASDRRLVVIEMDRVRGQSSTVLNPALMAVALGDFSRFRIGASSPGRTGGSRPDL